MQHMDNNNLWPLLGLTGVVIATGFTFMYETLWLGFFLALGFAIVMLCIMSWSMLREIQSAGVKKTVIFIVGTLSILFVFNAVLEWKKSENQHKILTEIRRTIDGSIAQMESEKILVESMRYKFQHQEVEHLEEAFRKVTVDRLKEDGTLLTEDEKRGEDLNFLGEVVTQDSIIIYTTADIALGTDPQFSNIDGKVGKYQGKAILTPNGVRYVRQN